MTSVLGRRWSVLAGRCGRVVGSRMPVLPSAVCRLPSAVCRLPSAEDGTMFLMSALLSDDRGVIVACPSCGARNRLAFDRLDRQSRCSKCHTDLALPSTPQEVDSSQQFDTLVAKSALPILVDFWAPWCGPCRMVSPEVEKVAQNNRGRLFVVKVNTDVVSDLASRLRIQGIPTLAIFAMGREAGRRTGAISAQRIEELVRETVG